MMMGMLRAGGMPLLTDGIRGADTDNPRGYFEYAPVKRLREDKQWVALARGKAVKVVSFLLGDLPPDFAYRVIFMRRALAEVLASQRAMLGRRGEAAGDDARMAELFRVHLDHLRTWLPRQAHLHVLEIDYAAVLAGPLRTAEAVAGFAGKGLDTGAMAAYVEPSLRRHARE
jgi:hypothetical protein